MSLVSDAQSNVAPSSSRTASYNHGPVRTRPPSTRTAAERQRRTNGASNVVTAQSDVRQLELPRTDGRDYDQIRPESSASQISSISGLTVKRSENRRRFGETSPVEEVLEPVRISSAQHNHDDSGIAASTVFKTEPAPFGEIFSHIISDPPAGGRRVWKSQLTSLPDDDAAFFVELLPPGAAPLASRLDGGRGRGPQESPPAIGEWSSTDQELCMIDDLLFVLLGIEGDCLRYAEPYDSGIELDTLRGPQFIAPSDTDPSIRDLAESIAQVGSHYIALEAFLGLTGQGDLGSVYHALCAAMRAQLKDYLILVAQLEHQAATNAEFSLHQFNLLVLPTSRLLLQMYNLAQDILQRNGLLGEPEEPEDESQDDSDDMDRILDALREGQTPGFGPSKKTCKGGALLGLLSDRLNTTIGDISTHRLLESLLQEASVPFVRILNEWLHHGKIQDPHAEFMIQERRSITKDRIDIDYTDEYWDKRYTIREQDVPPQLSAVKDKVLLAGKYLNVVRECGGLPATQPKQDELPQTILDHNFVPNVNIAYGEANRHLLHVLISTHELRERFRSLKHYFFLDRSDFLPVWLENAETEFRKPWNQISIEKLQNTFDLVINAPGSVASLDPFKDDVKISLNKTPFTKWLMHINNIQGFDPETAQPFETPAASSRTNTAPPADEKPISGYEALEFNYTVPFPLSLVISRKIVVRYQMIFRFLFSLRILEAQLAASWKEHNRAPVIRHRSKIPRIEGIKRRSWALRSRMLIFVQQLLYYATEEVIEPAWQSLMAKVGSRSSSGSEGFGASTSSAGSGESRSTSNNATGPGAAAGTVDQLMADHLDFLDTCVKGCMLTNYKLLRLYEKLTNAARLFAENYTPMQCRYILRSDPELIAQHAAAEAKDGAKERGPGIKLEPEAVGRLSENLDKYEDNFTRHLRILLDVLNHFAATETVSFISLGARLSTATEGTGWSGVVEQV